MNVPHLHPSLPPLSPPAVRRSSVVIGAVIVFVLAGLYATDRALTQASRERLRIDAAESATLAESFLSQRADALVALRAVFADHQMGTHRTGLAEYTAALTDFLPGIRRVWIADSSGTIVDDVAVTGGDHLPRADMDTVSALGLSELAARARATTRPLLSRPGQVFGDARGVVMLTPLCAAQRGCGGFVAALVSSDAILMSALRRGSVDRAGLTILAGDDTVATGATGAAADDGGDSVSVSFPTPDGGTWRMVVRHDTNMGRSRILLWTIGLLALGALAWGMARERKEALQAAERSRELERLSTEALRANRAKSEFLANVSHELRTPLNAIVGFVDLLRDGVYGALAPRQVAPVERIAASAGHLRHLVDQVLDIAKMAAGRLEVHQESVDLRALVFDVATEVEPLVSERQLAISLSVPASLPRVRTDPTHLRQILVNLIGNAVKYTPAGSINVKARFVDAPTPAGDATPTYSELLARSPDTTRAWIALQVVDTGIGIALGDQSRIFEEFEQVNAGPRGDSMHRGTGLGLPISRRLARLLGGDVSVQSELGKGSTFTVWIPVDRADIRVVPPRPMTPTGSPVVGV